MIVAKKPTLQIPTMTPAQAGFVAGARPGHNVVERPATLHDAAQRPEALHNVAERSEASHNVVERPATLRDAPQRSAPAPKAVVVWASGEERRRRTVYLRTETDDALEDYRKANRYPASEVIEEAVREYLRARGALR